ncbi:unnamed protein product, partial [Onchocerca ochengi]
GPMGMGR